ncbi:MAG TPA: 6-phosphofructokinase [Ruminococcaceae bacterium]|nr:6-phosphofructokinase [Oscillospiraceae bacterium]
MNKIGVLTSGGDSPGMNAAVRAVVRTACYLNMEVVGVRYGYKGLLTEDFIELNMRNVCDIIHRGGTKIYSARCIGFREKEAVLKAVENAKRNGIEGLVVIGGDGSFRGARDLSNFGLPTIAMPGTIDNDIVCTDYTIGFDTCLNTIQELVDRLRDTIESHSRCSVVEVMGARAGYLTLNAGIAVGATAIIIPEIPYDIEKDVINKILRTKATGKNHFIIMVAEGVRFRDGITVEQIAKEIEEKTGIETRATVLGHMQRGGSPSVRDRVRASEMGNKAVHLLKDGMSNRVVAAKGELIVDYDINEALEMKKTIDMDLYNCAMEISL